MIQQISVRTPIGARRTITLECSSSQEQTKNISKILEECEFSDWISRRHLEAEVFIIREISTKKVILVAKQSETTNQTKTNKLEFCLEKRIINQFMN